jgi:hypothetical protein
MTQPLPRPQLVAHMARLAAGRKANRFAALRECIERGVARVEIDVHSLAGDDYIVTHDRHLEDETTGRGSVGSVTPEAVRAARFLDDADDRPPLLSEVVALFSDTPVELQLDLKDWRPLAAARAGALLHAVEPMRDRVIVSTGQDWNLRLLHEADPALALGFDPGLYLDVPGEGADVFLPLRMGAYGYRDDHPLALGRTEDVAIYLRERFVALATLAPFAREWFLDYRLLLQMLGDGFDAPAWLREHGADANAWTLDYAGKATLSSFERLAAIGIARVTTNTHDAWRDALRAATPR